MRVLFELLRVIAIFVIIGGMLGACLQMYMRRLVVRNTIG